MKKILLLFAFILLSIFSFAQEEEEKQEGVDKEFQALDKQMNKLYDQGKLDDLINLFNQKCLKKNGNESFKFIRAEQETKADIYNLVSLALIATDRPDSASKYLKKLYVIKHSKDFNDEWLVIKKDREKYNILPNIMVGLNFGVLYSAPIFNSTNNVFERVITDQQQYANRNQIYNKTYGSIFSQRSYCYGFSVDYRIFRDLMVSCNPSISSRKFQISVNYNWTNGSLTPTDSIISSSYLVQHSYTLNYVDLPFDIKYIYSKYKFKPFLGLGYSYSMLTSAEIVENTYKNIQDSKHLNLNYTSNQTIQATDYFQTYHAWRCLLGVTYSQGKEFDLSFRAVYQKNFSPVVSIKNAYSNAALVWASYYSMDDFDIQSLRFELSFLLHLKYKAFQK